MHMDCACCLFALHSECLAILDMITFLYKKRRHVTDTQDDIAPFPIQHIDQATFCIDCAYDTSNRRWNVLCP
ncbi:hypothetical protein NY98_21665 [Xanthomonas citri pv. fuscans]|uniref:Secreted protein n=1 Tax=Xanthomonas citri pv. fuscans TaxID=366649 RepID=A0AB34Q3B8_XANCI|nr:hypothetical protein AC613_00520 [Xanthomonas citri pv. fuscans]KGU47488.1 hypothetical protein NY94_05215 [Xanthomonas phaseoli pv. phaseoli]AZU19813.1 hypothetical protein AC612_00520 [Xanthomonas citri pv. fuscans]AZU90886.1 hypothetical protein AC614_00520 [Xanthomonas citri pv. fuscans]KGK64503.1 hypothetical protein NB99_19165 [Xanthomonas citri pv. fuscans]